MGAVVTVFTSNKPQRLSKLWRRNGAAYAKEPAGQMADGISEQHNAQTPAELAAIIDNLNGNQALGMGVAGMTLAQIVPNALLADVPGAVSRTREFFAWPSQSGWMVLDYDPLEGSNALSLELVRQALIDACPELERAPIVGYYSGSSWIKDQRAGRWVTENRGVHLLVLVQKAGAIPELGGRLSDRLWLKGHGFYAVSKAGSLLERCLIDTAVWQPERLLFSAKAECIDDLVCERPPAQVWNNDARPLNPVTAIPVLTADEQNALRAAKAQAKNSPSLQQEANAAREAWVEKRMQLLPAQLSDGERVYARNDLLRAVQDQVLGGDFELTSSDGRKVLVADLLADRERWDGVRFCDPLEPDREDGDMRIAFARTAGVAEPFIYSHAHGGVTFTLTVRRTELALVAGEEGVTALRVAKSLADNDRVFKRGDRLLTLHRGDAHALNTPTLQGLVEAYFKLVKHNASSNKARVVSCPEDFVRRVLAALPLHCKPLRAVVSYPVMRPEGHVLSTPGYDEETGLYYAPSSGQGRSVPQLADPEALQAAVARVWAPFRGVCFVADADRCMYLALLLTTMTRAAMPTAPGFLIRAHMPGTGKTLLCKSALAVVGAKPTVHLADTTQPEEFAKRIATAVRSASPVIVFDNLTGVIQNSELNGALTSDTVNVRRFGSNDAEPPIESRSLWILNGNNVAPAADMNRRLLPISLDAGVEHPELRRFDSCPVAEVSNRREAYQDDLLAIMRAYHTAGAPVIETSSGLGSYDEWDKSVRQLILWLGQQRALPFTAVDVAAVVKANSAEDPEKLAYVAFLQALRVLHEGRSFTLRHMTSASDGAFAGGTPAQVQAARAVEEAASELAPARQGQTFNAQVLGNLLRSKVGQVAGGLILRKGDKCKAGMRYFISEE
jgi:hypothetical protein